MKNVGRILVMLTASISWGQSDWDVATTWCSPSACSDFKVGVSWTISMSTFGICHNGRELSTWAGKTAWCYQQALGEGFGYYAEYISHVLTENGWIQRVIGGVLSTAQGVSYEGLSTQMEDWHFCDDYRDTRDDPPINPC